LPFILALADKGPQVAMTDDPHLLAGLNVYKGRISHPAVAAALGLQRADPRKLFKS
jgi:alanine dehydrogenase